MEFVIAQMERVNVLEERTNLVVRMAVSAAQVDLAAQRILSVVMAFA
jgi:hypothetical protein